ncbi:MAG: polysaccharide deacetylase family protein [Chloroflexi bacterium]|nr:polysaccharide deacetylase family protein [Chloroflexota bacterium]
MFRASACYRIGWLLFFTLLLLLPLNAQDTPPFRVYLAFEDGPTDTYTPEILDTLAQYNARASFVISGAQIAGREHLLQREVREGHALINHLWEEQGVYAGAPADAVRESYWRTEDAMRAALGDVVHLYDAQQKMFWQPGGAARPFPAQGDEAIITYNWNVNSDDCGWAMPSTINLDSFEFDRAVIANVLGTPVSVGAFHNPYNAYDYGDGVIVIFHDLNRVTGRVLPTILSELQAAGATFHALPRGGDRPGTMPVSLGAAPASSQGYDGFTAAASVRVDARVRAQPSLTGDILMSVPSGTAVTAVGKADGWIQVSYEGKTGWIARQLLSVAGPIPNLPLRE